MKVSLFNILMASFFSSLLILVTLLISNRSFSDQEKSSPFECGFDPKNNARLPFSMRFFLLAVIFLVFDIEIALLLPLPLSFKPNIILHSHLSILLFMFILILGLLHEWKEGSLNWA